MAAAACIAVMTLAILSFVTHRASVRVTLRCDDLKIFQEMRDLEPNPPFADWTSAYATGHWTRDALLGIGLAIGNWLDAQQRWLTRLMQAPTPVTLVIETPKEPDAIEQAVLDAPWELIARVGTEPTSPALAPEQRNEPVPAPLAALLAQLGSVDWQYVRHAALEPSIRLSVVRRLGQATQALEPSKYRLSVVFMPCQPEGAADLSVDVQAAIRKGSGGIGMDLDVEDFGTLDGLGDLIARLDGCDVIQASCPATMSPGPALVLEGPRGEPSDTTAADIWKKIGRRPGLLVVSAYAAAATEPAACDGRGHHASTVAVGSKVLGPLAVELCQGGWPAVLALPGGAADHGEIELAAALYPLLAQRVSLLDAFARARLAVEGTVTGTAWHRARLLLGPGGGGQLVDSTDARSTRTDFIQDRQFLDPNRTIRIADDYQVSAHRRAFRGVVAALRDAESPGIVVHGGDEMLRATFVSRVLQRMAHELRRVVVTDFDASAVLRAVREQTALAEVDRLAKAYQERLHADPPQLRAALRAIVEGPCRDRGAGAFVLVLHDFDQTSEPEVLRALLGAFAGAATASRLLFTCSAPFSAVKEDGVDISRPLAWQSLDAGAHALGQVEPAESTPPDNPPKPPPRWRRVAIAGLGVAVAGLGALAWSRIRPPDSEPSDVPNMVRFKAADIRLGVFDTAALPKGCGELSKEEDCGEWQHPESVITIVPVAAFYMDKNETTNAEFAAWLNATTDNWSAPDAQGLVNDRQNHLPLIGTKSCPDGLTFTAEPRAQVTAGWSQRPVVCVTRYGAEQYCHSLNKRLPCEAEWELAAKGSQGRPFPWGDALPARNGVAYEQDQPRDVGTSRQDVTRDGVHDLAGNVEEWVQSRRDTPECGTLRGGGFSSKGLCRLLGSKCSRYRWLRPGWNIGFRCARAVDPARPECPVAPDVQRKPSQAERCDR